MTGTHDAVINVKLRRITDAESVQKILSGALARDGRGGVVDTVVQFLLKGIV